MQSVSTYAVRANLTSAACIVCVGIAFFFGAKSDTLAADRSDSTPNSKTSAASTGSSPTALAQPASEFQSLLQSKCIRCHGAKTQKAELNLSTKSGIFKGSESGAVIQPGKPEESLLYEMVQEGLMPPEKKDRLSKAQIETIRHWIKSGAPFTDSKSLRKQVTQHDIIPLLYLRCTVCHGNRRTEAKLDLRSKASMLRGGKIGTGVCPRQAEREPDSQKDTLR